MKTSVVPIFEVGDYQTQIREAAELLRNGKVVVLPTETVYGAAGLLKSPEAIGRLRALRPEPSSKPLTIHLAKRDDARQFLGDIGELGERMMKKLWPGPVAMVFEVPEKRRKQVAANAAVAENEIYDGSTITLRCPDHVIATDVIALANTTGSPLVMVRAGIATGQSAFRADHVAAELDGKVDLILDAGPSRYSKPSTIVKVNRNRYEIERVGVYDKRIIERLMRTTILFICSGNTCRSPMAEALTRQYIAESLKVPEHELENKGISVLSAGVVAMPGSRATPQAVEALAELGADLSRHRSRPLSVELIHQADMIYTMGRNHAMAVMSLVPSAAEKVKTLAHDRDVDDPIGGNVALYQELAGELKDLIVTRLREDRLP